MSVLSASSNRSPHASRPSDPARRIAVVRAGFALGWAIALLVVVGANPRNSAELMAGVALLLSSYPLIDVTASITTARTVSAVRKVMLVNAAVSLAAVIGLAVSAFGSDAGATLAIFGAWAAASGLGQLALAIRRRRTLGGQVPMILSGVLSTLAGVMFVASASGQIAHISSVAGFMALGAVLYLFTARLERARAKMTPISPEGPALHRRRS